MRKVDEHKIYRIIDANLNRAKEALRVCEDTARFFFDNQALTKDYKAIRHSLTRAVTHLPVAKGKIMVARDILGDVGIGSTAGEFKRSSVRDIFFANTQRAKESVRVLEEFSKLIDRQAAEGFKRTRYKIYELERKVVARF